MRQILRSDAVQTNYARLAADVARRSRLRCPECGSVDGMEQWEPWNLAALAFNELPEFWQLRGDGRILYAPCPTCSREIPPEFVPAPLDVVAAAWDKARFDYVGMD